MRAGAIRCFRFGSVVAAVAWTASACQRDPQALTEAGVATRGVYAFVQAGDSAAAVLVLSHAGFLGEAEGVGGAAVRLRVGGAGFELAPAEISRCLTWRGPEFSGGLPSDGPGCYAASLGGPLMGGDRLDLALTFPDGTYASGSTIVPVAPVIVSPRAGAVAEVTKDGLVELTLAAESVGAPLLEFRTESEIEDCQAGLSPGAASRTTGAPGNAVRLVTGEEDASAILHVRCAREPDQPVPLRTRVFALDSSAAAWFAIRDAGAVSVDRAAAGIRGAVGFFAAASESSVRHAVVVPSP